jgi:transposase
MGEVSTVGLDIAKSVFQVHGVDGGGAVLIRKRVGRAKVLEFFSALPPCLIGIEACPTAHHWSRKLQALGHIVAVQILSVRNASMAVSPLRRLRRRGCSRRPYEAVSCAACQRVRTDIR